ncbi:MAG: hypothetical protein JWL73_3100, partial [Actinomycetia bacterium]|nr:hypothetical protein [Actinomycetes bacterium]
APKVLVAALCAFLPAVYALKARAQPHGIGIGWGWIGSYLGPALILAAFTAVVFGVRYRRAPTVAPEPPVPASV